MPLQYYCPLPLFPQPRPPPPITKANLNTKARLQYCVPPFRLLLQLVPIPILFEKSKKTTPNQPHQTFSAIQDSISCLSMPFNTVAFCVGVAHTQPLFTSPPFLFDPRICLPHIPSLLIRHHHHHHHHHHSRPFHTAPLHPFLLCYIADTRISCARKLNQKLRPLCCVSPRLPPTPVCPCFQENRLFPHPIDGPRLPPPLTFNPPWTPP